MPVRTFVGLAACVNETIRPDAREGGLATVHHNKQPARIGRGDNDIGRLER